MCGRYVFVPSPDIIDKLEITNRDFPLHPNYNVAPGQCLPVAVAHPPKRFEEMRWGLIPFWAKDPRIGYRTINARGEEIAAKPSFRGPLKNRRCLIPASGFYEWKQVGGKQKRPYYIRLKSRTWFCFAGLYDVWRDPAGDEIKTYTIITTTPNDLVGEIHDRMPVILKPDDEDKWADNKTFDPSLLKLLTSYPANDMVAHPVSTAVSNPRNNDPGLITEIAGLS